MFKQIMEDKIGEIVIIAILACIGLFLYFDADAASIFNAAQIGTSAASGTVLLSAGPNTPANWVSTSTLGIVSGTGGGSGTVGTSSSETSGFVPYWTTTNGNPALLSGTSSLFYNPNNGRYGLGTTTPLNTFDDPTFNTTNSQARFGGLELDAYALNNEMLTENAYFDGSTFIARRTGAGGLFYFTGSEGQFRFMNSQTAGSAFGNWQNAEFKVNAAGDIAFGGNVIPGPAGQFAGALFRLTGANGNVAVGTSTTYAGLSVQQQFNAKTPIFDIASTTSALNATTSVFTVLPNGNVGVGTSSPLAIFSLIGPLASKQDIFDIATSTSATASQNVLQITPDGHFGINGPSDPSTNNGTTIYGGLNVSGAKGGQMTIALQTSVNNNFATGGQFINLQSGNGILALTANNSNFNFANNGVSRMAIPNFGLDYGNLGFGTTTPWAHVTVQGSYGSTSPIFDVSTTTTSTFATSSLFYVGTNGNVGISTSSPVSTLYVNGSYGGAILATSTSFTASSTNYQIMLDATPATLITVTLPTAIGIPGVQYIIKDAKGQSGTHNITIATTASQTIDGATTKLINANYTSVQVVATPDGNWAIE